ncbi:hypothetical protein ACF1BP_17535 [Streptomyces sp. NPDC014735]|uniref:hypothetical protein n=1 Tax=unclassified Streptomyces TaxID=2593676 RepID=UPI0036FEED9D
MVLLFLGAPSIVAHRRRVPCLGQVIVIGAFTAADAFLAADTGAFAPLEARRAPVAQ